jgi:hypothetical protein
MSGDEKVVAAGATILDKIYAVELQRCTGLLFDVRDIGKPVVLTAIHAGR